jgi:hypothetical protein
MKKISNLLVLFTLVFQSYFGFSQTALKTKLIELFPNATITQISNLTGYTESYQLILDEPLDHNHPEIGTFKHYVYLSHVDYNKPMVIETHGYNTGNIKSEVSKLLNTNQVAVEYRFYGKSRPNPIPWEYLTNEQAVADYHDITVKLKELYKGKWISTGISKGGETALIYKAKYPNDVNISVPYVAPVINTLEDSRTTDRINTNGTVDCRSKIVAFQRSLLINRTAVMAEFTKYATNYGVSYTEVPMEEALEYATLEFPFSFWQWGGNCSSIPSSNASASQLFSFLNTIVGVDFYGDEKYNEYLPSFYQHMTELGYYGFDLIPVQDLLTIVKSPTNMRFAPKNTPVYNPDYIKEVRNYLETKGDKIMYIYGGNDPWGACFVTPDPKLDYKMMVLPGGSHSTRIGSFPLQDQSQIMSTLNKWLAETTLQVPDNETKLNGVVVYNYISKGMYNVEIPISNEDYTIKVYTILGQVIYQKTVPAFESGAKSIDLTDKQNGVYILKIESPKNASYTQKLIKQ